MSKRLKRVLDRMSLFDFDLNPQPDRKMAVEKTYGITGEQLVQMAFDQGGKCAICGGKSIGGKSQREKYLAVDHCHTSNKVRGLLCSHCNMGLGSFKDSPELLRLAAAYLERSRK